MCGDVHWCVWMVVVCTAVYDVFRSYLLWMVSVVSYRCIVACAHLENGTGRRIATMVAPLLLTSGPVKYEALLHSCGTSPVGGEVPTCDSAHSW